MYRRDSVNFVCFYAKVYIDKEFSDRTRLYVDLVVVFDVGDCEKNFRRFITD